MNNLIVTYLHTYITINDEGKYIHARETDITVQYIYNIHKKSMMKVYIYIYIHTHIYTRKTGPWFNIEMSSYQYRLSHCGDKTVRSSYSHTGIYSTFKTSFLYWIGPPGSMMHNIEYTLKTQNNDEQWLLTNPASKILIIFITKTWLCARVMTLRGVDRVARYSSIL